MNDEQRKLYIKRALKSVMDELQEATRKLESAFCEILPECESFPEFEDIGIRAHELYISSQDLIDSLRKEIEKYN